MSLWELMKNLIDILLKFFRARKQERRQVAVEEAAELLRADAASRREVDHVAAEIREDLETANDVAAAYRRSFERLRQLQSAGGGEKPPGSDDAA